MSIAGWVVIVLVAGGGAFVAGRLTAPDKSDEVAAAIADNTKAMGALTEVANRPLVLDAKTREALSEDIPKACLTEDQSLTPACLVATCWRFNQSSANRPEGCKELLDDARIQAWVQLCGKDAAGKPDWTCIHAGLKAKREMN